MHGLGDGEELVAAVDHLPVGVDADAAQQRDVGGEQLGDAAAVGGGVDVEDPGALQRLGQRPDAVDRLDADDARVVAEVLLEQRDAFEHGEFLGAGDGDSVNLSSDACPRSLLVPTSSAASLDAAEAAAAMATRAAHRRASTTSSSSRSPTAAKARSTRCSPRAAGRAVTRRVTGPLGDPVDAEWALLPDGTAVVEMARASGLALVPARTDPLRASTRGTGELIAAAVRARRAPGDRRRRRQRDDRRRARARSRRSGGRSAGLDVTVACDVDDAVPRRGRGATGRRRARPRRRSRC